MEKQRKIVEINEERCDGCGQCVIACAEGAIEIINGKAKIIKDSYCDGLGACLGECPQGALKIIEREAEEFDPEAVEEHLKQQEHANKPAEIPMACGCPSSNIRVFGRPDAQPAGPAVQGSANSALSHWPVQIRLVPPNAPFLKGADLLIAADCTPIAYPNFHRDFLDGKAVLIGCPKFDDGQEYVRKFTEIFRSAGVKSVTVVDMEVPCCSALPAMVKKAMELSGSSVPMEEVVVGVRGDIIRRKNVAA